MRKLMNCASVKASKSCLDFGLGKWVCELPPGAMPSQNTCMSPSRELGLSRLSGVSGKGKPHPIHKPAVRLDFLPDGVRAAAPRCAH